MSNLRDRLGCELCPQHCSLQTGQSGLCRVRGNVNGEIKSLNYGEIAAWHVDPIEKKPLYHFYPGSRILSVGGYGCNLRCSFCQNYEISQTRQAGTHVTPTQLASMVQDSLGLCFTYSEPLTWFEMIRDTAPLVKAQGGKVVLVSNGVMTSRYIEELIPMIDAVNVDIKGFSEAFYRKYCGGKLQWVLDTVQRLAGRVHMEITTLIIPGGNDDPAEIKELAIWLKNLNVPVAWHLSRYFPAYQMQLPATDQKEMIKLWELAKAYLPYVYLGNMTEGENTFCPECGKEVIHRHSNVIRNHLQQGNCPKCGYEIFGVGL